MVRWSGCRAFTAKGTGLIRGGWLPRWLSGKEPAGQETQETQARSLGREDPLEWETATQPSVLAWEISWAEEPGGLRSTGSQRAGHSGAHTLLLQQRRPHKSHGHRSKEEVSKGNAVSFLAFFF